MDKWTNGQMDKWTGLADESYLKDATVKRYYYETHPQLTQHLYVFVNANNFAKRLKTLKGLTPYEFILKSWHSELERFNFNPNHHNLRL